MVPRKHQGQAGRKRMDTAKFIEDPAARRVAFTKHCSTLFRMAGDLSALCGVDTTVIIVDGEGGAALTNVAGEEDATIEALRKKLEDTKVRVEAEKARNKAVDDSVALAMEAAGTTQWWKADVNALDAVALPVYEAALRRFRGAIIRHIDSKSKRAD
jgi:hypothetical protein